MRTSYENRLHMEYTVQNEYISLPISSQKMMRITFVVVEASENIIEVTVILTGRISSA